MRRNVRRAAAAAICGAGGYTLSSEERRAAARRSADGCLRAGRCATAVGQVVLLYRRRLAGLEPGSAEREAALRSCHRDGAARLLRLCEENTGLYVKIGQLLGQMIALVPDEYTDTMRVLFDAAPARDYADVRAVVCAELGAPPEEVFARFDETPIAAASLAQVHRATLRDGSEAAVKVQHRGLGESAAADIATVTLLVRLVRWLHPDADFRWLAEEGAIAIRAELDFHREAENIEWAQRAFAGDPVVRVPSVSRALSTQRVLTMSFERGTPLHDPSAVSQTGADPAAVSAAVMGAFRSMVFEHGRVHADPHPGNILLRAAPEAPQGFEVVLLDHGLYRELNEGFSDSYAALWWALVRREPDDIRSACAAMGMEQHWHFFASIVSLVPWKNSSEMRSGVPDQSEMQDIARTYFSEISRTLAAMPREMALVLKTRDALAAMNRRLGVQETDDEAVARAALRRLQRRRRGGEQAPPAGVLRRWCAAALAAAGSAMEALTLEVRLLLWRIGRRRAAVSNNACCAVASAA
eukprot:TRINITY_DN6368_c0_g1_i1.p1 TRINITY_DN6368_c0_g1~~TRINITY_DN6368_c0_g1_i1.p1  ORF type:complete len:552 (+),score=175.09 TRINITY_DN6368_c0_g1_i1:79-1656(+)